MDIIRVHRDLNKDINQHMGFDRPEDNVGPASAGCLVGRLKEEHREFMRIIKTDPRRKATQGYKLLEPATLRLTAPAEKEALAVGGC